MTIKYIKQHSKSLQHSKRISWAFLHCNTDAASSFQNFHVARILESAAVACERQGAQDSPGAFL